MNLEEIVVTAVVGTLAAAAIAVLGWAAVRLVGRVDSLHAKVDALAERQAKFDGTLKNGIAAALAGLGETLARHIDGEEERILAAVARIRRR